MAATFSININQLTESTRKTDITSVLNNIPDNTQKLIEPKDVRDAVLSIWANTPFKVTTPNNLSNYEYIGIDSSNPNDRDIKKKILLGKRSYGGLDIMNSTILNNNNPSDIFLYNTKQDSATQSTKISILAGTNSVQFLNSPYIEAKPLSGSTTILNINNALGNINILSTTDRVSINNIIFPTQLETASASNGDILKYDGVFPFGSLKWQEPIVSMSNIGNSQSITNIYGSTVSVNNIPIEFIENDLTPVKIGGITQGSSFSNNSYFNQTTLAYQNWPITEVIKKLLYPYTEPVLTISNNKIYAETGTTASITLNWSITTYARNEDEKICSYQITNTNITGLSFSGLPGTMTQSSLIVSTYSNINNSVVNYVLKASDTGSLTSFNISATTSVTFINPIFYGFANDINGLIKKVEHYPGIDNELSLEYDGSGYLYFVHNYPTDIKQIIDPNGFILYNENYPTITSFTMSSTTINGYTGSYKVWKSNNLCSYPNGIFKFIF